MSVRARWFLCPTVPCCYLYSFFFFQRKVRSLSTGDSSLSATSAPNAIAPRKSAARETASDAAKQKHRKRAAIRLSAFLKLATEEDRPFIVNQLLDSMSTDERSVLRGLQSVQQERYLAQSDLVRHLRRDFFSAKAGLTVRLENFMPSRVVDKADSVLAKKQRADGTWYRPIIVPMPKG